MDKESIQLTDVTRGYHNLIGKSPLIEAPVLGAAGATAGYLGGDFISRRLLNALMVGKSEAEKAQAMEELRRDGTLSKIRALTGAAGGALGAGYSLYNHADKSNGIGGIVGSILNPKYYDSPENLRRAAEEARASVKKPKYDTRELSTSYSSGRTPKKLFGKVARLEDPFMHDTVPLSASVDLINADPFLTMQQKNITGIILEGAENKGSGMVSGKDLTRSALRLGVGLATGYTFGKVTGKLLSLPKAVTGRLSGIGAIAGGIVNTGIFNELGGK